LHFYTHPFFKTQHQLAILNDIFKHFILLMSANPTIASASLAVIVRVSQISSVKVQWSLI